MRYGFKAQAERISAKARQMVGLPEIAPLPARVLAEAMRVAVLGPRDIPGLPEAVATQLLFEFEKNWSGVLIPVNGENVIVHNTNHLPERQESNIMHELAHLLCKHKPARIVPPGRFPWASRSYDCEQEEQAAWLGGCLQLPRCALLAALKRRLNNPAIAEFFGASVEMVRFRRNMTGIEPELARLTGATASMVESTGPKLRRKGSKLAATGLILQPELF